MVRFVTASPLALACAAAALLGVGCFDTSSTITTADYPTVLTVDPSLFRGNVPCGAPGLERYVVTLTDLSQDIPLRLTPVLSPDCQTPVSFGVPASGDPVIIVGHYYVAAIDGYDRKDVKLDTDADGATSTAVVDMSGNPVTPKWTTTCGEAPPISVNELADAGDAAEAYDGGTDAPPYDWLRFPTLALGNLETIVHGCAYLVAPAEDASVDDGSSSGVDASHEIEPTGDAGTDVSVDATEETDPDGGAGDDGGDGGRTNR